jgi:hypothetical protein
MNDRNDSALRIIYEALWLALLRWRAVIVIALMAGGGVAVALRSGYFFLGFMGAGALVWRCPGPRLRAAGIVTRFRALKLLESPGGLEAERRWRPPAGPMQLVAITDQVLAHYPRLREAKLIKAGLLWHLHGDRDGARGYCRDLLCQTRTDDPLMEHICDLYRQTSNPGAAESGPPGWRHRQDRGHQRGPIASRAARTRVIPFHRAGADKPGQATTG